jgi:acyl phosphate:glycerol-3-phosphate acyltransferase
MNALWIAAALIGGYLVGSLSFAVIVSRVFGLADPRSYGSKNPGATNVLRSGHKPAALMTLAFDALKAYVPVLLVLIYGPRVGLGETTAAFTGLAAFVGHLWPVFFGFKGGKGVATGIGMVMAINPQLGLCVLASFAVVLLFSRYVSLAAIVGAVFAPFYQALIWGVQPALLAMGFMSVLLVWRHEGNIKKLLAGTENKFGQQPAAPSNATSAVVGADKHHQHDAHHKPQKHDKAQKHDPPHKHVQPKKGH